MRVLMLPGRSVRAHNEYPYLLAEALEREGVEVVEYSPREAMFGSYDLLHVHWPDHYAEGRSPWKQAESLWRGVRQLGPALVRGKRLVWTVHNLRPHQEHGTRLWRWIRRVIAARAGLIIHLTPASLHEMEETGDPCATVPHVVAPHGMYPSAARADGSGVRAALGVGDGDSLIVFAGRLHRYKGVERLIEAFRGMADGGRLLIAGPVSMPEYLEELRSAAAGDERIGFEVGLLDEQRLSALIAAADLVALPYRAVLNSGAAMHALSAGTPVLLPRTEAFSWLRDQVDGGWVTLFDELDAEVLRGALEASRSKAPNLASFEWDVIGRQTAEGYAAALGRGDGTGGGARSRT